MKKMVSGIAWILLVMMIFVRASADDMYSISDIRSQAELIAHWNKDYHAHGRTILVNIPIVVPEANEVPVVEISIQEVFDEKRLNSDSNLSIDSNNRIIDSGLPKRLDANASDDSTCTISRYLDDKYIHIKYNAPSALLGIRPKDYLKCDEQYYFYEELSSDTAYAEDNELTLVEAKGILTDVIKHYYQQNTTDEIFIDYVRIIGRGRKTTSYSSQKLGDYVDYYPTGSYGFSFYNTINDIPILIKSSSMYEDLLKFDIKTDHFGPLSYIANTAQIMSRQSLEVLMFKPQIESIIQADVPLVSLDKVIENIEKQIEDGYIRNVYSLRFGYGCYLNDNSPNTYTLYPVWVLECDYVKSSKAQIKQNSYSDNFRDGYNYTQLTFNAQTGIAVNWAQPNQEDLLCPSIISW